MPSENSSRGRSTPSLRDADPLHFDVSTGLKRVLGRELITDDEVALFELVKNSFDAEARNVYLHFDSDSITIADNGIGMSYQDLNEKWLFVAYSSKRDVTAKDFREQAAERKHYAGSKGIGRFSSDRLGGVLELQTRTLREQSAVFHQLVVDWNMFEVDNKEHFETVPVSYSKRDAFSLPSAMRPLKAALRHGTVIKITGLRKEWYRRDILHLKSSLAKLINPFGSDTDDFSIHIIAPAETEEDERVKYAAKAKGEDPLNRDLVNGKVGNLIFSALKEKTTFIRVWSEDSILHTVLTDRGEIIYEIKEPSPYTQLVGADFRCEIYYLNQSAKLTFARRVGLPSIQFGSVFLFRNGFRVFPIGDDGDDWFDIDRRKQQGYNRFLGTRDIIGRVDIVARGEKFQEASSRDAGLINSPAVSELRTAVMDHGLKRLERYVVPVSWKDNLDKHADDLSRISTDDGRARVSAAVARLVDNDQITLLRYSKQLVSLLNERSIQFEDSLSSLRVIAEKTRDRLFLQELERAEKRFAELRESEAEALRRADEERAANEEATERAEFAEAATEHERRRANFLETVVNVDTATILNLHHQVTIYAGDIAQQIENLFAQTVGQETISRAVILTALEQIVFLDRKILAVTRFASKALFQLDSENIDTDLANFIAEYIDGIVRSTGGNRTRVTVVNNHPGLPLRFKPIDVSIILDNLISNSRRAKASVVALSIDVLEKTGLALRVSDNGQGLAKGVDPARIFEMGYTSTRGSGLGLYHVRQILNDMGGSIELDPIVKGKGLSFTIKIAGGKKAR